MLFFDLRTKKQKEEPKKSHTGKKLVAAGVVLAALSRLLRRERER